MRQLLFFHQQKCPYCEQAAIWLEELTEENPEFAAVSIRKIDENKESELADRYDYWKVPTFFLGEEKLHEGAATKEIIRSVLTRALEG